MDTLEDLARCGWRYALALTADPVRADDLLQDGWAAILRAGGPLQRAYLLRAIRARWIDGWRRAAPAVHAEGEAVTLPAGGREVESVLAPAWAALRDEEREALHLCVVEGYTAAEAAELLGCPRNTVLSLWHRGRHKLRAALERYPEVLP